MAPSSAKVRVAAVAGRQWGRIARAQLVGLGVPSSTVAAWLDTAYLHRKLPRVYAVGHPGDSVEARLMEAILYAGPGAVLSHYSAIWWWGLDDRRPAAIEVSTPRRCQSLPAIQVHERRSLERTVRHGLAVTTVAQALLDYAAGAHPTKLRRVLANADYRGLLKVADCDAMLGHGRPGSAKLMRALKRHRPQLARTRSDLEVLMFELCEAAGIPLPEVNARIHRWTVDFLWREQAVVVEVDGCGNHRAPAQIRRDRRKDFELRTHGLTVLRYSDEQVERHLAAVSAEVSAAVRASPPGRWA
jgi:hypothetical protein